MSKKRKLNAIGVIIFDAGYIISWQHRCVAHFSGITGYIHNVRIASYPLQILMPSLLFSSMIKHRREIIGNPLVVVGENTNDGGKAVISETVCLKTFTVNGCLISF